MINSNKGNTAINMPVTAKVFNGTATLLLLGALLTLQNINLRYTLIITTDLKANIIKIDSLTNVKHSFNTIIFLIKPINGGIPAKDKRLKKKVKLIHMLDIPPRSSPSALTLSYNKIVNISIAEYTVKNIINKGTLFIELIIIQARFIMDETAKIFPNLILRIPDLRLTKTVKARISKLKIL